MSHRLEKKRLRRNNSKTNTVNEFMTFVGEDRLIEYLSMIMKRFAGYKFISVSKPRRVNDKADEVTVYVHKDLPIQDKNGFYKSGSDMFVRKMSVDVNTEFEGLVMDRSKRYAFGNPFKDFDASKNIRLPSIGEDKSVLKAEDEFVEPL